jgi:putative transposase
MGSVGDAYDNATAESFFRALECELLDRCSFRVPAEARQVVFRYRLASGRTSSAWP